MRLVDGPFSLARRRKVALGSVDHPVDLTLDVGVRRRPVAVPRGFSRPGVIRPEDPTLVWIAHVEVDEHRVGVIPNARVREGSAKVSEVFVRDTLEAKVQGPRVGVPTGAFARAVPTDDLDRMAWKMVDHGLEHLQQTWVQHPCRRGYFDHGVVGVCVVRDGNTRATRVTAHRRFVGEVEPGRGRHPSELCDGRGKIEGKVSPGLRKEGDRGHPAERGPSRTVCERSRPSRGVMTPQAEDLDRRVKTQMLDGRMPGAFAVAMDTDFGDGKYHLVAGALGRGGGQTASDVMSVRSRRG